MTGLALLVLASLAQTQQDSVRVRATLSSDRIVAGESTILEVRVESGSAAPEAIRMPSLPPGFEPLETRDFTQIQIGVTGTRTRVTVHSVVLTGRVPGSFLIPGIGITVAGRRYRTTALPIVVTSAPTGPAPPGTTDRVRLTAHVEPRRAWIGQQVTFVAEAVFPRELRQRQTRPATYQPPNPAGFWAQDLPDAMVIGLRTIGNEVYETQTFRRAYFPLTAGRHAFPPAQLSYEYRPRLGASPEARELLSDSLIIDVQPLPVKGRPAAFAGAVGHYSLHTTIDPLHVGVGEAATLRVEVRGAGNVKALPAPVLTHADALEVFPPTESANVSANGEILGGTKAFSWVLVPRQPGHIAIPPVEFSYFDPATERYERIRTDTIRLDVSGATVVTPQPLDLRPLHGRPSGNRLGWVLTPWFAGAQAIPVLLLLLAWVMGRRAAVRAADPGKVQRRTRTLEQLRQEALAPDPGFWGRLAEAVRTIVGDTLDQPGLAAASAATVATVLAQNGVPRPTANALAELLDGLDRTRFAPGQGVPADAPALVDRVDRLLEALASTRSRRTETGTAVSALLLLTLPFAAHQIDFFQRGVIDYTEGHYAEAGRSFASWLRIFPDDADAWYDAGSAYFQAGQPGSAVRAWIRAIQLEPGNRDARHNLHTVSPDAGAFVPPLVALALPEAAIVAATIWWVTCLLMARRLWLRRPLWPLALPTGVLLLIVAAAALAGRSRYELAVANEPEISIHADPALRADEILRIRAGTPVAVIERREGWTRVRTASGTQGWLESGSVIEVGD